MLNVFYKVLATVPVTHVKLHFQDFYVIKFVSLKCIFCVFILQHFTGTNSGRVIFRFYRIYLQD